MALDIYALVTLLQAKDYMKVEHTEEDTLIEDLINRATYYLEQRKYQRALKQRTFTDELYNGMGTKELRLSTFPVKSVSSVSYVDDGGNETTIDDYRIDEKRGILFRHGGWLDGVSNYKITWVGGYDPIPYWLEQECLQLVSDWYEGRVPLS